MPTIREVARLAGVSVGTVSHVISNSVPVSEELTARVNSAIRALDYHPNHIARSLKTSQSRTLGIIIPNITIHFFPRVVRGAESAVWEHDYSLITLTTDDDLARQNGAISLLRSKRVDGILLISVSGRGSIPDVRRAAESGIPVVCLDRIPPGIDVDSACTDNCAASEACVEHLIAMGHRRVAILTGLLSVKNEQQRLRGYRLALRKAGLDYDPDLVWVGSFHEEEAAQLCQERLVASTRRPTALFTTNGVVGLGALRGIYACGLKCPDDIAFVTFDELVVDDLFEPRITTLVQPAYQIGYRGAEALIQRIQAGLSKAPPVAIRLPGELRIRESSLFRSDGGIPTFRSR
jgi:DNA-binding LacI/PurR family transcriptional regulator